VRVFEHKIPFAKAPPPVPSELPESGLELRARPRASNPPSHESRFLVLGRFSPCETLTLATLACCLVRRCVSHGRNSEWTTAEALCGRTGHDDCNPMEMLASPVLQPTLVTQVTESRDQHHRSPSGVLRTYPV
jgi:hypothetical protein